MDILGLDKIKKISDNTDLEISITGLDMIRAEEEGEAAPVSEPLPPITEEINISGLDMIHSEQEGESLSLLPSLSEAENVNITGTDNIRHIFFNQFPKMSAFALQILGLVERAKDLDIERKLYGSQQHRYEFAPVLPLSDVRDFEERHEIQLPAGYVEFLTQVGNGGAGPDFGIYSLDELEFRNFYAHSNRCVSQAHAKAEPDYFTFPFTTKGSPVMINSALDEKKWQKLCAGLDRIDRFEESALYEKKRRELYNGIIQIVNTDAAFCPVLICGGDLQGQISDFSHDLEMPRFSGKSFEEWLIGFFESVIAMFSQKEKT